MSRTVPRTVVRAALRQARTTLVRKYASPSGMASVVLSASALVVLWFLRDVEFGDGVVPATGWIFAGFLAFGVVAAAIIGVASELQTEREDGTLLRAKAVPHGMTGHLLAKLLTTPVDALVPTVPIVVGAALIMPDVMPSDVAGWLLLALVFLLTVAAMMPWGAVLGAVFRSMMTFAWALIGIYALAAVSGLFFPASMLPAWLQWPVMATPMYWVGRVFRGVLLPEAAGAAEVGGSWMLGLSLLVLLAWAVVGLVVAPLLLRRMARRQSGSLVAAARERVMQRGY